MESSCRTGHVNFWKGNRGAYNNNGFMPRRVPKNRLETIRDEFMVENAKLSNKFDELLLLAIDETMKYVMGERNAAIIYRHLEANYCAKEEIPQKLELFSSVLRDLIGNGRGQMLGAACILEETIAEALALKLGEDFVEKRPVDFVGYIEELKKTYLKNH